MSDLSKPIAQPRLRTREIPTPQPAPASAAQVASGRLIPPQQQILLFSHNDWEDFVEEWVFHQRSVYTKVTRFAGPGDMGIDVAGFRDELGFDGAWDNFQCKHHQGPIAPKTALIEIAKCLLYAFRGCFRPPHRYYFMAPKNVGIQLKRLLLKPDSLKDRLCQQWDPWCRHGISSKGSIALSGDFRDYVRTFDFSVFTFKPTLDLIEEHRQTPYHSIRFGGGLRNRPKPTKPPTQPTAQESRYIQQLVDAYRDHTKIGDLDTTRLRVRPELERHYHRQREFFYHAESLKNFARDTVPQGTFDDLQDEIHAGVVDKSTESFTDALARLNAVTQEATGLALTANALISVVKVQDRRGICHQLANDDRLTWKRP